MANKSVKILNPTGNSPIFNFPLRFKYIILALTGFVFYANSIFNKYALDDNLIILNNANVQMGVSGIPKIITNDAFAGYYSYIGGDLTKGLSGGRYRPLSEIIFAIEQQLFGTSSLLPYMRHLVNVLAYVACVTAIFYFLENILLKKVSRGSDIAFFSAFLFAIHPIHTEVVANIKSLDEILSLLFIILTFINSFKYLEDKKIKFLIIGTVSFLLALLSKEYAVTLLFLLPLFFYLKADKKPLSAILAGLPYYSIFLVYLWLRYNAIGFHFNNSSTMPLNNNPYLYATVAQKVATEWFVLGKYLGLLLFPFPLSCDYSYYQITYQNFSTVKVLFSIVIYFGIFIWGIKLTRQKNILSFAVFFFLLNIFMISNFVLNIGATMGERLVFHSSLGLVLILSYYLFKAISKMPVKSKKSVVFGIVSLLGVLCFGETVIRNSQWKDDTTLFIHDVKVVPHSFLANNNAGWGYLKLSERIENTSEQTNSYRDSARKCLFRALFFNPKNEFTYHILGVLYVDEELLDSAHYCFDMVEKLHPNLPDLKSNFAILSRHYFNKGLSLAKNDNKPKEGIILLKKALLIDSTNESIWYDLGIAYNHTHQYDSEKYALMKTLQYKPDSFDAAGAKKYLGELSHINSK